MLVMERLRRQHRWSLRDVGRMTGLDPVTILKLERGDRRNPRWQTIKALEEAYGRPGTYLLAETETAIE